MKLTAAAAADNCSTILKTILGISEQCLPIFYHKIAEATTNQQQFYHYQRN